MHTPLCKHATGEPEEYAARAKARGLAGIIITCHNPIPNGWSSNVRMRVDQFDQYVALVERARQAYAGQVDVRLGLESDYAPGMEPWLRELHQKAPFNYILGSVHPQVPEYRQLYWRGDPLDYQRTYFKHLADAAETHLFDAISHPDLIKNDFPNQWDVALVMDDIRRSLDRIAASHTAMELNTSGLQKAIKEINPSPTILAEIAARHIPIVLGSDSHTPERVAADFESSLELLRGIGFKYVSYFLDRQWQEVKIPDALASLKPADAS